MKCPSGFDLFNVGIFWFVASYGNGSRLISQRSTFDPDDGGIQLHQPPYEHAEVWPAIQRLNLSLAPFSFEHFPRGRLEFMVGGRRWLLFVDAYLTSGGFIDFLADQWLLPRGHLTVEIDPAYHSADMPDP